MKSADPALVLFEEMVPDMAFLADKGLKAYQLVLRAGRSFQSFDIEIALEQADATLQLGGVDLLSTRPEQASGRYEVFTPA